MAVSRVELACACDAAFLPHAATMIVSALAHARAGLRVHLLHGPDIPPRDAAALRAMVERGGGTVVFHLVPDDEVAGFEVPHFATLTTWYRVFLPELLADVPRALYIDADCVVTDALEPLWETDLDGAYVAAVTNVPMPWNLGYPVALGLPGPEAYFNGGVLLCDLDAMRRDGIGEALREYGRTAPSDRVAFGDQDALNVVLSAHRKPLAPRWNCMNGVVAWPQAVDIFGGEAVHEARTRPAIRHFEGPSVNKPWHFLCELEGRELYREHRRHTPWPLVRLEGAGPRNRVRRAVRGAQRRLQRVSA